MTLFTLVTSITRIGHFTSSTKSLLIGFNPYEAPVYQTNITIIGSLWSLFWSTWLSNILPRNKCYICVKSSTFATWPSLVNKDSNICNCNKYWLLSSHKLPLPVFDTPSYSQRQYTSLRPLKNPFIRWCPKKALSSDTPLLKYQFLVKWGNGKKDPSKQGGQCLGQRLKRRMSQ